ncbi:MAG: hypothetical protein M0R77_00555 [Gammaproteobacteria bacterium]|nr:hypothetical protein [Acholeplasmataceae bacterium]MCK9529044.1 hypothetical protein [Gammaproteobacteria bacterium]
MQKRSKNTQLNRLLTSKDKNAYSVTGMKGVLAHIFRKYLSRLKVDEPNWSLKINQYIKKYEHEGISKRQRSSIGNNLTKALSAREMSWITFLRGLNFLGAIKIEFTVKATFHNNRVIEEHVEFTYDETEVKFDFEEQERK